MLRGVADGILEGLRPHDLGVEVTTDALTRCTSDMDESYGTVDGHPCLKKRRLVASILES
jgi:hypothetical protein